MTHSRETLVLKSLYAKWSRQARLGKGKFSSCVSECRSKEGLRQYIFIVYRSTLALGLVCSGFLGRNTSAVEFVQWEGNRI